MNPVTICFVFATTLTGLAPIKSVILAYVQHSPFLNALPLYLGGALAICHSICTSLAAATYHSQRKTGDDCTRARISVKSASAQSLHYLIFSLHPA